MTRLVTAVACWLAWSPFIPAETVVTNWAAQWAVPINEPGLPNLHRVDGRLYRGAQPSAEGFRQLKATGVKTVIDLRSFHSDDRLLENTGLGSIRFYMKPWHAENDDVVRFLQIVTDTNNAPCFVHCQHGADRTGTMCAIYRIAVCGWTKDQAIDEMTNGGFGFHPEWQNLINYVRRLDIDRLKKPAGMAN